MESTTQESSTESSESVSPPTRPYPIHFNSEKGKWSYYDETWTDSGEFFDTEEKAREGLAKYSAYLDGGPLKVQEENAEALRGDEKQNAPEAEITLNPEALKVQQNASAAAIVQRAVEFIRRQGSATERIIDILEYKALREEVRGFMLTSYELQLEKFLAVQAAAIDPQPSEDSSPAPEAAPEGTVQVEEQSTPQQPE